MESSNMQSQGASEPNLPTLGSFDGFVEMIAAGWAYCPASPSTHVTVQLLVDDLFVAERVADMLRADLRAAGHGDGSYGVRFELPARLLDGKQHKIEMRVKENGAALNYSPRVFCSSLFVHRDAFVSHSPAIDQDGAEARIATRLASGEISADLANNLIHWHREGYVIWRDAIDPKLIAKCNSDLDRAIAEKRHVRHHGRDGTRSLRDMSGPVNWESARLLEFHSTSEAAAELILHRRIVNFLSAVLEGQVVAMQSLLFVKGSTQRAHMDFPYVHTPRPGFLAASWIALEDVREDAGPLFYYPRSHRLVPKFDFGGGNVMAFQDGPHVRHFEEYVDHKARAAGCERKLFMAKAGDVLMWHSALVHGGSPLGSPSATRRSLVGHYSPRHVYSSDRKHLDREPKVVSRNGGVFYDFQGIDDPQLEFPL
jgi:ectoine hydroxylase-related dioxygenase (phytanoyl-CoA dioxygenase family)